MFRSHRFLFILALVGLMLMTVSGAAAKDRRIGQPDDGHGKPVQAQITWSSPRLVQAVVAGQSSTVTATFTSSADLAEATLVIPGRLGKLLQADSATLTDIKAGALTTVTFTLTMPAQGAHTQGGVVMVRAGQRMLARPLPVLLTVAHSTDMGQDEHDGAKPAKPAKAKPTHP